ncbi:ankyrin [Wilcoxina mikolae CBS 423.85]|nr:ankyrin [Wilcoxina mikolae CBS 423.85]
MPFSALPNEIILDITDLLWDPCDYNAFMQVNRATYAFLSNLFKQKYHYPTGWMYDPGEPLPPDVPYDEEVYRRAYFVTDTHRQWAIGRKRIMKPRDMLITACRRGYLRLAKALVKKGAPVYSVRIGPGQTSSHPFTAAVLANSLELVDFLWHAGAPPFVYLKIFNFESSVISMIHLAAALGRAEIVQWLLDHRVLRDKLDQDSHTPLNHATAMTLAYLPTSVFNYSRSMITGYSPGYLKTAKILLYHGANPNYADGRALPAPVLAVAAKSHEILQLLIDHGANLKVKISYNHTTPGETVVWGDTVLHRCMHIWPGDNWANEKSMSMLLKECKAQIDINAQNMMGKTALHVASQNGLSGAVRLLLDAGADTSVIDDAGYTARERALQKGFEETARLF